jgi:RHS repeat-associated protein
MMQIAVVLGWLAASVMTQAGKLPEFMNAEQLAAWRAQHAAPAVAVAQTPDEQTQFFTGKPYDATSGTYLFKYRSYNPGIARWTSADPSGFPDGANNFEYCLNFPTGYKDDNGLTITPAAGTLSADKIKFDNALQNLADSGPTGRALVNAAKSTDFNIVYDMSPNNGASSHSASVYPPASISLNSANGNFASDQQNTGAELLGELTSHPEVVLAHELGHALIDLHDLADIALIENAVRSDIGEDQRTSYRGITLSDLAKEYPTQLADETFIVNAFKSKYFRTACE